MNTLGERLKYIRKKKGLTQVNIADETQIARSNIGKIENDEIKPSAEAIVKICSYMNISIDWLLTGKENEEVNLSQEEKKLIEKWNNLTERQKGRVEQFIENLTDEDNKADSERYNMKSAN